MKISDDDDDDIEQENLIKFCVKVCYGSKRVCMCFAEKKTLIESIIALRRVLNLWSIHAIIFFY